ncbi:MAG: BspA family leucine-rich repeat surface protein, partial [Flammeovirgaceae bacterium]
TGSGYNYTVDWGDGTVEANQTSSATHTYATANIYTVKISGDFPRIYFNGSGDKDKILSVEQWGTTPWESMHRAFRGCSNLVINATDVPDLSHVTDLGSMFENATNLTGDLSGWNVETVTNMSFMFEDAKQFNGDITTWNVSNVEDMSVMFRSAFAFNQDISNWNTGNARYVDNMFKNASAFNQDIGNWNVSSVENMEAMFENALAFNQDLSNWNVSNVTTMADMFDNSNMSNRNYDHTLIGWSALTLQNNVSLGASGLNYCHSTAERQSIIDTYTWNFAGDSESCDAFITTWETTSANESITIPTNSAYAYNYEVNWGDGTIESGLTGNATHTYVAAGTYTVTISGTFPSIDFGSSSDARKILTIEQWGDIQWEDMSSAFSDCRKLTYNATDSPDLSDVTSMARMFRGASSFNASDLNTWDVSTITDMNNLFSAASVFNGNISAWNVSNVTNMEAMFQSASAFNQPIGDWNTSKVTAMEFLFESAGAFNQDISDWDISNLTSTFAMFSDASSFDQNLGDWNMSNATFVALMFNNAGLSLSNYDSTLIGWAAQTLQSNLFLSVNGLKYCFATAERQHIIDTYGWSFGGDAQGCSDFAFTMTWETTSASESITIPTNSNYTYDYQIIWGDGTTERSLTGDATHTYATAGTYTIEIVGTFPSIYFNNGGDKDKIQTIEQWGPQTWSSLDSAFYGCSNLTINATDTLDLSNVSSLVATFREASAMNSGLLGWDLSNITSTAYLFQGATAFNQDISSWNVASITDMTSMFEDAKAFDQNIGNWNISSLVTADNMLDSTGLSEENYENILSNWSTLTLQNNVAIGVAGLSYCDAYSDRQSIIDNYSWTFSGDVEDCSEKAFMTTWEIPASLTITIPTTGSGYDYTVYWGDGTIERNVTGDATHTYATTGTYTVVISGAFPRIYFNNTGSHNHLLTVEQWGEIAWNSMERAFTGCENLKINATDAPDLSSCTSMDRMFWGCDSLNQDISHWNVSNITHMDYLFLQASTFNQPLNPWNVSSVQSMISMFSNADSFNQPLDTWEVSAVTSMNSMFSGTDNFNQDISGWNVAKVTDMVEMFNNAVNFNANIGAWNVSNVENMEGMFGDASAFDQDISNWNVAKVALMDYMFSGASSFNQDIGAWNVSNVSSMQEMFFAASAFNQNLEDWNVTNVTEMSAMLSNTAMSVANYDSTLIGWSALTLQPNVSFGGNGLKYCTAISERQAIIDNYNWSIDDEVDCSGGAFTTTWQTTATNESITIPTNSAYTYNYTVDWGDGTVESGFTGDATHTYASAGTYTVYIQQIFPAIYFNNSGDAAKIQTIEQWGAMEWSSMQNAFYGCTNLTYNATDAPDLSKVTNLNSAFQGATSFNGNISNWDVSNVTSMMSTFQSASIFDQAIGSWNVSQVQDMDGMFMNADKFNQDLSSWNTSSVQFMGRLFMSANAFNGDVSTWDVSQVTDMSYVFSNIGSFNRDISAWNTANVTNMESMFNTSTGFNQDISGWDISKVSKTHNMFLLATSFDQNLGDWDMRNVSDVRSMFRNSGMSLESYDSTLIGWATQTLQSNLTFGVDNLTYCKGATARQSIAANYFWTFSGDELDCSATAFTITWETTTASESLTLPTHPSYTYDYNIDWGDGTIEEGLTGDATHTYSSAGTYTVEISGTFPAIYFNNSGDAAKIQTIEQWGDMEWSSMQNAFYGCTNLTYNATDAPDLDNVTNLNSAFQGATSFNGDISNWDVSNVTSMMSTFQSASIFDQAIGSWNVSKVQDMDGMFMNADKFNQDLSSWNTSSLRFMGRLFRSANAFKGDISTWDVSQVRDMSFAFSNIGNFNGDLSAWNTANVNNMENMFNTSTGFNQDISGWDLSNVGKVNNMFIFATSFDQNLGDWDMSNVSDVSLMFRNSGMSTANYDSTLMGWSAQTLQSNLTLGATGLTYCLAIPERQKIIDDFNWVINDDGLSTSCAATRWNGSTWTNNQPTSSITAYIESDYDTYTDGELEVENLIVQTGHTLTVRGDSSVTVAGDLTNEGMITVQDTTSFVQTATSPSNLGTGGYTVAREVVDHRLQFNYWTSPVQNTDIATVFGSTGEDFYTFDAASQAWATADQHATLGAGEGFIATGMSNTATTITRSFSDSMGFHSGTIMLTPEFDGITGDPGKNWNLVGNPYPSGLDAVQFLSDNSSVIENAVYLWSSAGNDSAGVDTDYATMNAAGTVNAGGSGIAPSSANISSCQGFFVQTKAVGDITFQNSQRTNTNNTFMRTAQQGARAWISVTLNDQTSNEILLGFFEDGEWEKDRYDAAKLSGNAHLAFYSQQACTGEKPFAPTPCPFEADNKKWVIQGLPSLDEEGAIIPLGLEAKTTGKYTFSINHLANFPEEAQLYFYDALTEKSIHLQEHVYTLELDEGTYEERFYLNLIPSRVTSVAQEEKDRGVKAYAYQDQIHIQFKNVSAASANIGVFDISGRLVYELKNEKELNLTIPIIKAGIYILKLENEYGVLSKKLLIK